MDASPNRDVSSFGIRATDVVDLKRRSSPLCSAPIEPSLLVRTGERVAPHRIPVLAEDAVDLRRNCGPPSSIFIHGVILNMRNGVQSFRMTDAIGFRAGARGSRAVTGSARPSMTDCGRVNSMWTHLPHPQGFAHVPIRSGLGHPFEQAGACGRRPPVQPRTELARPASVASEFSQIERPAWPYSQNGHDRR
jgi:hypothetical protein